HAQRRAVGELVVGSGGEGGGGAVDHRARRDGGRTAARVFEGRAAGEGADRAAERGGRDRRGGAARAALEEHVAGRRRVGIGRGAAQIARRRATNGGRDVRLGRIADLGLQRLVGDRLRGIDQVGQRGDAGVGGLQHLNAVADAVEQ